MAVRMAKPALDVGIVTAEAGPVLSFYRSVFGFIELPGLEIPGVGTIHKLGCGESVLRVMVPTEPPPGDAGEGGLSGRPGFRYLTLEVDDAHAAVKAAEEAGGSVVIAPFELRPDRVVAQITDPDGNLIEVGQGQG